MPQIDQQINLKLGDSEAVIHFAEITDDKKWLHSYVDLTMSDALDGEVIRSVRKNVLVEDWYKLCEYFEKHIAAHEAGIKRTMMFTPSARLFRIFASAGTLDFDAESVALRFMVNVGTASSNRKIGYRYAQALVHVSDIREFAGVMREFLRRVTGDRA